MILFGLTCVKKILNHADLILGAEQLAMSNEAADQSAPKKSGIKDGGLGLLFSGLPLMPRSVILASLAINVLMLAMPMVVLQVYDRIIPNKAFETLLMLVIGISVALVLDVILKTGRGYIAGWGGAHFEHTVGVESVKRMMGADIAELEKEPAGKHLDRLAGVDMVRDFYTSQAGLIVVDFPFVFLFLGAIAFIAGWLVLIPLILLLYFGYQALRVGSKLKSALKDRLEWDNRRYSFIIEVLSGLHSVKSSAMERLIQRRYERLMSRCSETGLQVAYLSGVSQNIGSSFAQISQVGVVGFGSMLVINGQLSAGGLAACMLLAGRSIQPVLKALGIWARFQSIQIARDQLDELSLYKEKSAAFDGTNYSDEPLNSVEMDHASFRYGDDLPDIIKDCSLKVRRGEIIGIRGKNGSGKTTFLRMLLGSLPPTEGKVFFNGKDAAKFIHYEMQHQIAFLPQKALLFEGTVMENITMFRNKEKLAEAIEVASWLGLDKVFARFPDGFDTIIGASTHASLPGGVSQRIAIARSLINRPKLILYDEANNALDGPADARLIKVLKHFSSYAGIVLVSYRPSILNIATRRYDLVDGTLVEQPVNKQAATPEAPQRKAISGPETSSPIPPSVAKKPEIRKETPEKDKPALKLKPMKITKRPQKPTKKPEAPETPKPAKKTAKKAPINPKGKPKSKSKSKSKNHKKGGNK